MLSVSEMRSVSRDVGLHPGAILHQGAESAHHQSGAHQQHHGQRHLRRDQQIAQAVTGASRGTAAAALLQGVGEVGPGTLPRRGEPARMPLATAATSVKSSVRVSSRMSFQPSM